MVSPLTTDLLLEKSPAENNVPVVLLTADVPPTTIKQPATVAVPVMVKLTALAVVLLPAEAALNDGVPRTEIGVISDHVA